MTRAHPFAGPGRPPVRRLPSPRLQHFSDRRHISPPLRRHPIHGHTETGSLPRTAADPYPRRPPSPSVELSQSSNGKAVRTQSRKQRGHASHAPLFIHEPQQYTPKIPRPAPVRQERTPSSPDTPRRTMLERKCSLHSCFRWLPNSVESQRHGTSR